MPLLESAVVGLPPVLPAFVTGFEAFLGLLALRARTLCWLIRVCSLRVCQSDSLDYSIVISTRGTFLCVIVPVDHRCEGFGGVCGTIALGVGCTGTLTAPEVPEVLHASGSLHGARTHGEKSRSPQVHPSPVAPDSLISGDSDHTGSRMR